MSENVKYTNVSEELFTHIQNTEVQLDEGNLTKSVMDLSIDLEVRLKALDIYYKTWGWDAVLDIINKITTIYEMSGTKVLRNYIFSITQHPILDPFIQSLCSKALWEYDKKDILAYESLEKIYPQLKLTIGTPYKIEFLKMLLHDDGIYGEKGIEWFCEIINDEKLNCNFRYKTIQNLSDFKKSYSIKCNLKFFYNDLNELFYRIIAGQYLLQNGKELQPTDVQKVENTLLEFSENKKVEYNLKADALDVLLQYGSVIAKQKAEKNILFLGVGDKRIYTVYNNAQNVHRKEIEESVNEALKFLQTFEISKGLTLEKIQKEIIEETKCQIEKQKINSSFTRIDMDRALYGEYNSSLAQITLKIWSYILGHKNFEEMRKRFVEELKEMCGTCSSGFASRLVNTISGFGDFNLKLSWEDQIISNLSGRLNAKIRDMDNLRLQEKVLEEMTISAGSYESRKNFLKFFRNNILSIREEMYEEFKNHISDADYDLYFRKGISMYETGNI